MLDFLVTTGAVIGAFFINTWFGLTSPVHTPATECGERGELQYCYFAGDPASTRTVWFMHGYANDRTGWSWNSVSRKVEAEWKKNHTPRPHVVALSFGRVWWYTEERRLQQEAFLREFEQTKHLPQDRVLYGDSMGGHNSLRWAAASPGLFPKLALICPAVPLAFTTPSHTAGDGMWPFNLAAGLLIGQSYAGLTPPLKNPLLNPDYWKNLKAINKLYVAVSTRDHLGFYPGGKEIFRAFRNNGTSDAVLEEHDVRHCDVAAQGLAPFLAQ